MLRTSIAFLGVILLLAIGAAVPLKADELPMRKTGFWEEKISRDGRPEDMIVHECVDEETEKKLGLTGQLEKAKCGKIAVQRTANGYVVDRVCSIVPPRNPLARHSDITGSFDSAYTDKTTNRGIDGGIFLETVEARWLGACPADWKPGEREVPGRPGVKTNEFH